MVIGHGPSLLWFASKRPGPQLRVRRVLALGVGFGSPWAGAFAARSRARGARLAAAGEALDLRREVRGQ